MNKPSTLLLALALATAALPASAAGNVEQGKSKSVFCMVCHGTDGSNSIPMLTGGYAKLTGMDQAAFMTAMKAYRYGQRFHPLMQFFVLPLAEQDMEDLAAYYASLGVKK
jgi:cytochrome c553